MAFACPFLYFFSNKVYCMNCFLCFCEAKLRCTKATLVVDYIRQSFLRLLGFCRLFQLHHPGRGVGILMRGSIWAFLTGLVSLFSILEKITLFIINRRINRSVKMVSIIIGLRDYHPVLVVFCSLVPLNINKFCSGRILILRTGIYNVSL